MELLRHPWAPLPIWVLCVLFGGFIEGRPTGAVDQIRGLVLLIDLPYAKIKVSPFK